MKKKIFSLITTLLICCFLTASLASCGAQTNEEGEAPSNSVETSGDSENGNEEELPHVHAYNVWKTNATHHWRECSCGAKIGTSTHGFTTWSGSATEHWKACECGEIRERAAHTYVDGDTACTVCGREPLSDDYTRVDAEGNPDETGEYVYFGSYPQARVTGASLIETLTEKAGRLPEDGEKRAWTSYEYYAVGDNRVDFSWYIDITHQDTAYRGVYFTQLREASSLTDGDEAYQAANGYNAGSVYWFEYQPLLWKIVNEGVESDGESYATLLCQTLVDGQTYQNLYADFSGSNFAVNGDGEKLYDGKNGVYANNYEWSSMRAFLNDSFFNAAFDADQKAIVQTVAVDNGAATTGNPNNGYKSDSTEDKVWLLSYQDANNADYGFLGDGDRVNSVSAYAQCQGVKTENGLGGWWLRSPLSSVSNDAWYVSETGKLTVAGVDRTYLGVRPVLKIKLS